MSETPIIFEEDREAVEENIAYRLRRFGYHEHCRGCAYLLTCGIPQARSSVIECWHRPGPMFNLIQSRRLQGTDRSLVGGIDCPPQSLTLRRENEGERR